MKTQNNRLGSTFTRLTTAFTILLVMATAHRLGSVQVSAGAALSYDFKPVVFLGDPVPGGDAQYFNDFEVGTINNQGQILFGADISTDQGLWVEGVFLLGRGEARQFARGFTVLPGNVLADFGFPGPVCLNDHGDATFGFFLSPFSFPLGLNSALFRYAHNSDLVTPLVLPGVTPVPGGGVFAGIFFGPVINNRGDILFTGVIPTENGLRVPGENYLGLGLGAFKADKHGTISKVVIPGDPTPGGSTFDVVSESWMNDGGDVAFLAHALGEPIVADLPQEIWLGCASSLYLRTAGGKIELIAQQGSPAPGGRSYRNLYGAVLNNEGDIVYQADLRSPSDPEQINGVYLRTKGQNLAIARPGDSMPGGGILVTPSTIGGNQIHLNNRGEIVFNGTLDTDQDSDGLPDTGLWLWERGQVKLIARTGTVLPGIGTIRALIMGPNIVPPLAFTPVPNTGALNNDRGQVVFGATLADGRGVLLLATPML